MSAVFSLPLIYITFVVCACVCLFLNVHSTRYTHAWSET